MLHFAPYALLQCLGALLAWALIARRGVTLPSLAEAGVVWTMPLAAAAAGGLSADTVALVATCGVLFNLANWVLQSALRRSG